MTLWRLNKPSYLSIEYTKLHLTNCSVSAGFYNLRLLTTLTHFISKKREKTTIFVTLTNRIKGKLDEEEANELLLTIHDEIIYSFT